MAKKKTTTGRQSNNRSTSKKAKQTEAEMKSGVRDNICGVALIAIGVFMLAAELFDTAGEFGNLLGIFLKGSFGIISYVLPLFFIGFGILLFLNKTFHVSLFNVSMAVIMFVMMCLLNSGRYIDAENIIFDFKQFYAEGSALKGGGLFGMMLGSLIVKAVGKVGLYMAAAVVFIVAVLLIVNKPVAQCLESAKEKKDERLRERAEKRAREEIEALADVKDEKDKNQGVQISMQDINIQDYQTHDSKPESEKSKGLFAFARERKKKKEKESSIISLMGDRNLFGRTADQTKTIEAVREIEAKKLLQEAVASSEIKAEEAPVISYGLEEPRMQKAGYGLCDGTPSNISASNIEITSYNDVNEREKSFGLNPEITYMDNGVSGNKSLVHQAAEYTSSQERESKQYGLSGQSESIGFGVTGYGLYDSSSSGSGNGDSGYGLSGYDDMGLGHEGGVDFGIGASKDADLGNRNTGYGSLGFGENQSELSEAVERTATGAFAGAAVGLGVSGVGSTVSGKDLGAAGASGNVGAAGNAGADNASASGVIQAPDQKLSNRDAKNLTLDDKEFVKAKKAFRYKYPQIGLLNMGKKPENRNAANELKMKAMKLEETLKNFNVDARVIQVTQGPAVTRYEIQPNVGVKVSSIVRLSDDIALNLEAKSIRIEAPIPGKAAVGIEVENEKVNMVTLREIIDSSEFREAKSKITFAVGRDIAGKAVVADLKTMPHLLIAGSTGSGKSVCINSIITSILYKASPEEVKLVLIDPKVVELGNYNGIPHLLIPVVTEPTKAAAALNWAVAEMTSRYKKFAENHVRDLESYNNHMRKEGKPEEVMPQVVIIIDELADLMMAAPSQVEESICRLAQMARAAGMHLIVATQRPSVDIITGVIKANIPSRIAFAVSSQFDSRTILDMGGAEKLVGKGDMLFNPLGMGKPVRVQGTFISDDEVTRVIDFVKSQVEDPDYSDEVIDRIEKGNISTATKDEDDELLEDAIACVISAGQASVSMLQRRFRIGYNRSARIVDMMEERGIVGPQDGSRPRQVLVTEEEYNKMKEEVEG